MIDRAKELIEVMFDRLGIQYDDYDIEVARVYFNVYAMEETHNYIREQYTVSCAKTTLKDKAE